MEQKLYTIRLDGIVVRAYHGCYDLEQMVGNRFRVDLAIKTPLGDLPRTDDVGSAVNYLTVFGIVEQTMKRTQRTIEAAASNIIEAVRGGVSADRLCGVHRGQDSTAVRRQDRPR